MNVVLHLGGNWKRAATAARVASKLRDSGKDYIVVVSSEGNEEGFRAIYREAGIPDEKVIHDTAAWDTVTNFTHTYRLLRRLGVRNLWVVTSDFHMERAMAIAEEVWGGRAKLHRRTWSSPTPDRKDPYVNQDRWRARLWRWFGILFYWGSVMEDRKVKDKLGKGHALLEIPIG